MNPILLPPNAPWVTVMADGTYDLSHIPANKPMRNASKAKIPRPLLWVATRASPSRISSIYRLKIHQTMAEGEVTTLESSMSSWSLRSDFGIGIEKNTNCVSPGTFLSSTFLSQGNVQLQCQKVSAFRFRQTDYTPSVRVLFSQKSRNR